MSRSTVIVAVNAQMLSFERGEGEKISEDGAMSGE
jgi:hypothetical protein